MTYAWIVRLPKEERSTTATLDEYLITAPDGRHVPLSHVATLTPGKGPATITRIDRYRTMTVSADIDKERTNMTLLQADLDEYLQALMLNYPGVAYSYEGEAKEQRKSFASLRWGIFVILFVIYVLLALPLKSYVQPLIVMSVIPFGVIGAIWGHWIMGRDLTFTSLLGLMALVGVVVNDSLVLVDFINQRRAQGLTGHEAVLQAGVVRFRPVLLTSLTTFFGLLPLLFEKSVQAQFLIPMGISLGFGILFATAITLIMVPANVIIVEDIRRLLHFHFPRLLQTGRNHLARISHQFACRHRKFICCQYVMIICSLFRHNRLRLMRSLHPSPCLQPQGQALGATLRAAVAVQIGCPADLSRLSF